jgi:uncharacterized membrane protein YbhN (UPF0104 family)
VVIVAVLVSRLGGHAVLEAVRATSVESLVQGGATGVVIIAVTTACGAWRWQLIASRLHVELPLRAAVAACYRSQFLNVTLPGGVLGDVDRGLRHGSRVADLGAGLRAVAWERAAGQVVLAAVTAPVLLLAGRTGSSFTLVTVWTVIVASAVALGLWWALRAGPLRAGPRSVGSRSVRRRVVHVVGDDVRSLRDGPALCGIVVASLVVVAGHLAVFVVAARAVGVDMPVGQLVPLALVVLLGAMLPLNIAGWGPREGVAAWAFATAGQDAPSGVAVAVVFGVIVSVATLPGAVLVLTGRTHRGVARA